MSDDAINHPKHYTQGTLEVIDAIEGLSLGFHAGNVVKYVARAAFKGDEIGDLKKARWYLDRLIERASRFPIEYLKSEHPSVLSAINRLDESVFNAHVKALRQTMGDHEYDASIMRARAAKANPLRTQTKEEIKADLLKLARKGSKRGKRR